jgi:hypothetical protein
VLETKPETMTDTFGSVLRCTHKVFGQDACEQQAFDAWWHSAYKPLCATHGHQFNLNAAWDLVRDLMFCLSYTSSAQFREAYLAEEGLKPGHPVYALLQLTERAPVSIYARHIAEVHAFLTLNPPPMVDSTWGQ